MTRRLGLVATCMLLAACGSVPRAGAVAPAPGVRAAGVEVDMTTFVGDAFARADVDRDSALSGRESGLDAAQFKVLDRDASGQIERVEWGYELPLADVVAQAGPFQPMIDEVRKRLDSDGDRALSLPELRRWAGPAGAKGEPLPLAQLEAARKLADADGDGRIAGAELTTFYVGLGGVRAHGRGFFSKLVDAMLGGYLSVTSKIAFEKACHPKRFPLRATPEKLGLKYENVAFKTADGLTIKGWFIPAAVPTEHTVIGYHGIDDNRDYFVREKIASMLNPYVNQLLPDLRNQGESEGDHTTFGYDEGKDVQAAYTYLAEQRGITSAAVYGVSLGGATAIRGGAIVPQLKGVIDDCTYATVQQAFAGFVSITFIPCPVLIAAATLERGNKAFGIDMRETEPISQVMRLAPRPLLIIHGQKDMNIAPDNSSQLFTAAGSGLEKELWIAPGAGHAVSAVVQPQEYERRLSRFVTHAFGIDQPPAPPVPVPAPVIIPPGVIGR